MAGAVGTGTALVLLVGAFLLPERLVPTPAPVAYGAFETEADFPGPALHAWGFVEGLREQGGGKDVRVNDPAVAGDLAACHIQSETTVAAYENYVFVGFNDGRDCTSPTGVSYTGFARSADGGESFEDLGPLTPGGEITDLYGDPIVVVDTRGRDEGTVYLASLSASDGGASTLAVGISKDFGKTFDWQEASPPTGGFPDKEWLAIDNTGGVRDGWLYLAWRDFGSQRDGINFARSEDGGFTWTEPVVLETANASGVRPAVGPDGELYLVWERMGPSRRIAWVKSTDGGTTFTEPEIAAETTSTGHNQVCIFPRVVLNGDIRTQEFPSIAIDVYGSSRRGSRNYNPHRGTVYIAFSGRGQGLDESNVNVARLMPGGSMFNSAVQINDDTTTTDQFFPEIVATGPGRTAVVWSDRREDATLPAPAGNRLIAQYVSYGRNGGATFTKNERLSDVLFPPPYSNPNTDPLIASCYSGDYNALYADGRDVLAAWGDNRDGLDVSGAPVPVIPDPNAYFRRFPAR